jgi:hypothetical protein
MVCGQGRRYCRRSSVDCDLGNFVVAAAFAAAEMGAVGAAAGEAGVGYWRGQAELLLRRLRLLSDWNRPKRCP